MGRTLETAFFGAAFGMLLFVAPSEAGTLPIGKTSDSVSALSQSTLVHSKPTGARCVKWTRRWNTRHGFGRRHYVQWR